MGGTSGDFGRSIAVSSTNDIYITGSTGSSDFPTQSPFQSRPQDSQDAFVTGEAPFLRVIRQLLPVWLYG
ncbi:MAG: SBBP repeat-containing protein [Chloroflexi bacterium]|nr:SBBP repeat-containing protein [Chloroflexota bacterium]